MKIATFHYAPVMMFKPRENGSVEYDGLEFRLLDAISQTLNFTYDINSPADGEKWGRGFPNGSWTGYLILILLITSKLGFVL